MTGSLRDPQDAHHPVGAYVVDVLEEDERAEFETHLSSCAQCQDEVQDLRETTVELTRLVAARPPEFLRADLLAQLSGSKPEDPADTVAPLDQHPSIMPWDLPGASQADPLAASREH